MGRAKIDREAFKVGYKGLGQVPVVNERPLVCWVSSARSADAREARFFRRVSVISCVQGPYVEFFFINQAFFLDISKKTQGQKNSSRKKLKQIFEKLKQIIQKLNNLPTKNWLFAQKSPEVDIFCTKVCPNLSFKAWNWENSGNFGKNFHSFE